jgi:hypothetical protein
MAVYDSVMTNKSDENRAWGVRVRGNVLIGEFNL